MTDIPGVSVVAQVTLLIYVLAPFAGVCALARFLQTLFSIISARATTDGVVVGGLTLLTLPGLCWALCGYVLAIIALARETHPDTLPDLSGAWSLALLTASDRLLGLGEATPLCLSLLAAAGAAHAAAELLNYLLGAPCRRRNRLAYNGALNSISAPDQPVPTKPKLGTVRVKYRA